jgi:hypothetical protein
MTQLQEQFLLILARYKKGKPREIYAKAEDRFKIIHGFFCFKGWDDFQRFKAMLNGYDWEVRR